MVYNLPNMLTISRLGLAGVFFLLLAERWWVAVPVLLVAGLTDILDGYLARRRGQQTDFGRVADPVIDKILICGGFIMVLPYRAEAAVMLQPWMVALIVGRELLVTSLRGFAESRGTAFAATFWGKSKMLLQFVTLVMLIAAETVHAPSDGAFAWVGALYSSTVTLWAVWATVIVTTVSGAVYLVDLPVILAKKRDA